MTTDPEFAEAFEALKSLMKKHEKTFRVLKDEEREYTLVTKSNSNRGMPMWFGSVRLGKAYVSYHLMPLYFNPPMNALVSPALKKRMQGKTCFNFKKVDKDLFAELKTLTQAGVDDYRKRELL
ncbi:MAG TPA: hypothetical protein VMT15_16630 [Bryobacteraceae bacterium]|nr:hypothetical protein [Bryobacteraceae bacterium]